MYTMSIKGKSGSYKISQLVPGFIITYIPTESVSKNIKTLTSHLATCIAGTNITWLAIITCIDLSSVYSLLKIN